MDPDCRSEYQDKFIPWPNNYTKMEDEDCTCWRFKLHKSYEKCPCTNKKFFNNDPILKVTLKSIAENYRALIDQQKERAMKFNVKVVKSAPGHAFCASPALKNPLINRCEEKCKQPVRRKDHPVCQELENRTEKLDCFKDRVGQQDDQQNEQNCCCCSCCGDGCCCESCCCNGSPNCCDCCCCQEPDPCEKCNACPCPNVYVDNSQREEFLRLQLQVECEPQKYCEKMRKRTCFCHRAKKAPTVEDLQRRPFKGCSDIPLNHSFNHFVTTPDIAKLRYMQNEYKSFDDWYTIP